MQDYAINGNRAPGNQKLPFYFYREINNPTCGASSLYLPSVNANDSLSDPHHFTLYTLYQGEGGSLSGLQLRPKINTCISWPSGWVCMRVLCARWSIRSGGYAAVNVGPADNCTTGDDPMSYR